MACDDCDYRWKISLEVEDEEEAYEEDLICPMCGSSNVAEI
jgi:Zn finger protein HypA/HybF involved in hydrogenase expression